MPGSRQRRASRIAALVIGGALTLSACGSSGEGESTGSGATAAVVEGETITVGEVQQSSREVAQIIRAQAAGSGQQPQELGPDTLLSSLVQVDTILAYAQEEDIPLPSDAAIEKQLADVVASPSKRTIDFFRANAVYSQLDQQQQQEIAQQVQGQDVTFSPRYASVSGEGPNWLEQADDQAPLEAP
ncbi:SurA N-terminal domain-containing protein [Janibacter sp. GS2]|uniref:SurA N-terminal domain-containing protein n=1 Tax=Janibacter sp. GS2 TaxID=3442646 RepID=UPI003EC027FC